jgi:cytidyltransferase-like protein
MTDKIILVTGGFDPIHSGHIAYFESAKQLGYKLIVGVNSDAWLARKKSRSFMPYSERTSIVRNLRMVDEIVEFNDDDNSSSDAIVQVRRLYPDAHIVFANGGDRTKENIPEMCVIDDNLEFMFSVGGDNKANSSSWILQEWKHPSQTRIWGKFMTYYEAEQAKVKRLILEPGKSISMQYHEHRAEFWFIEEGHGTVFTMAGNKQIFLKQLNKHDCYKVERGQWHRLENTGTENLCVIEIQYGEYCKEEDIIRRAVNP